MENHHPLQTIDKQAITAQKNHWFLANGLLFGSIESFLVSKWLE